MIARALLVVVVLAAPARADDITFADALAGVGRTPQTRASEAEVASALAGVDAAGAWGPMLLTGGTNRLTAKEVIGVSVPLPILGTVGAAKHEAAAHAGVVRAEAAAARRDVQREVALAWLAVARADAETAALRVAVEQAAELERIAQGRLEAGAGAEVDVTTAKALHARALVEATAAAREQQAVSAELAGILGRDPLRTMHAVGPLPGGTIVLDALRGDLAVHPTRSAAASRIGEDEASEVHIATERRPGLALEGQVSLNDPTTPGTDVFVALTLELPVFGHIGDRLRAARAHTHADRLQLQATDARLDGELVAAYDRWQGAAERLASLERDVLPAQERSTQLAQQAYREGARDLATALQASRDLSALRAEAAGARIAASSAWVELMLASGRGLDAR